MTTKMTTDNLPLFKCRCSSISKIMSNSRSNPTLTEKQEVRLRELRADMERGIFFTEKKIEEFASLEAKELNGKKVILSDTCIEYLLQWYSLEVADKVSVEKEMVSDLMQLKKGRLAENDSIALLSVYDGQIYEKNDERVNNDFLVGEPDIIVDFREYIGAKEIIDIKSVWDYPGFLRKTIFGLDNGYELQVQGYMDICNAPQGWVSYCLVDMPEVIKLDFKKRLFYTGEFVSDESPAFLKMWEELEKSMTFTDIPPEQRVHKIKIEPFTESERQKVYDRVKVCREWLNNFHESRQKLTNLQIFSTNEA